MKANKAISGYYFPEKLPCMKKGKIIGYINSIKTQNDGSIIGIFDCKPENEGELINLIQKETGIKWKTKQQ